jgi:hypothetical protein
MDRRVIQVFVALLVFVLATSAAPTLHPSQDAFREWVDPFVDGIGLWQGQWELFGPEVDKVNVAVVGVVEFADGERVEWRHPVWRESSPLQKFRHFRLMEFTDGLRQDSNRGAWRAFAEYVVRTNPHPTDPSVRATRVSLWRQFVNIPVPRAPLRPIAEPVSLSLAHARRASSVRRNGWKAPRSGSGGRDSANVDLTLLVVFVVGSVNGTGARTDCLGEVQNW